MIAGVVLAAGLSRRMGQAKLLLALEGKPVVRHAVERVLASGVERVVVVVPPEFETLRAALEGLPIQWAVNLNPSAGQGVSIAAGIDALPSGTSAVLIALADQPVLPSAVIPELLAVFGRTGMPIVAPRYREGQGNPVLFGVQVFSELRALTGDQGARSVIEKEPGRVAWVDFDLSMPADVDTPEDYDRLRSPDQAV
jgi:molybdenum cofactor cytidylyltransferase